MSVTARTRPRARAGISSVILRVLPGQSPLHRAWAGSKILALTVLTITGVVFPTWTSLAILFVVTVAGFLVAGATPSAIPRLSGGIWVVCGVAAVLAWAGGALAAFVISMALTAVLTLLAAIAAWTTPLADIAPAMAVLWSPLARIGLPVNEWCLTAALAIRAIPLFFDEVRVLIAARRLRGSELTRARGPIAHVKKAWAALVDVLTAILAAAQRRANEFGRSMTLRGGVPQPTVRRPVLNRVDVVLLSVAFGSSALMVLPVALGQ
jgi:energy-coupling factor transport system permease protein